MPRWLCSRRPGPTNTWARRATPSRTVCSGWAWAGSIVRRGECSSGVSKAAVVGMTVGGRGAGLGSLGVSNAGCVAAFARPRPVPAALPLYCNFDEVPLASNDPTSLCADTEGGGPVGRGSARITLCVVRYRTHPPSASAPNVIVSHSCLGCVDVCVRSGPVWSGGATSAVSPYNRMSIW